MKNGDQIEALAGNLAANLRYIRERRGLTQGQVATQAGLPRSTVSQVETGAGNPTLAVLARLARALGVTIEELLSAPHSAVQVFRRGELPVETRGAAVIQKLLPDPITGMDIDRIELPAGARMAGVPHRPGTREYLTCEIGKLTLYTSGDKHTLAPGDVAAFQGDQPHSYVNEGSTPAVGFSVVTLVPSGVARQLED